MEWFLFSDYVCVCVCEFARTPAGVLWFTTCACHESRGLEEEWETFWGRIYNFTLTEYPTRVAKKHIYRKLKIIGLKIVFSTLVLWQRSPFFRLLHSPQRFSARQRKVHIYVPFVDVLRWCTKVMRLRKGAIDVCLASTGCLCGLFAWDLPEKNHMCVCLLIESEGKNFILGYLCTVIFTNTCPEAAPLCLLLSFAKLLPT